MNPLSTSLARSLRLAPCTLALLLAVALRADEPSAPPAVAPVPPAASAEKPAPVLPAESTQSEKLVFRLGAFAVTNIDTTMSLTSSGGQGGTVIDFGNTLGGDTSVTIFRADADWFISGPHSLAASWYDINLTGHRVIDREIHWGDNVYPINADIDSSFRTSIYKLSYGYTWRKGEKHEITGLIGAHIMRLSTKLSITNVGSSEGLSVTAPLPAFGLGWTAHWTDRFDTRATVQYFGISLDEQQISGHFYDVLLAAEYRVSSHFSVGAGYNRFDLNADVTRGPLTLSVKDAYNGFLIYLGAHF